MSESNAIEDPSRYTKGNNKNTGLKREEIQNMINQSIENVVSMITTAIKQNEPSKEEEGSYGTKKTLNKHSEMEEVNCSKKKKTRSTGCTYPVFQSCKPPEFAGNEGAIIALRWIEKMESVLAVSKCARKDKILFATNSFKDEALDWWNAVIQIEGRQKINALNWSEFKGIVTKRFCPTNEREQIENKFFTHKMVDVNVREYNTKFLQYLKLVPYLTESKSVMIGRYI